MAKKSDRSPIGLNLTPELPQVVSKDFNYLYLLEPTIKMVSIYDISN
jgi:hypothetical protein